MALLLTVFMVLRVFWIMLGLWAEAKPAASELGGEEWLEDPRLKFRAHALSRIADR